MGAREGFGVLWRLERGLGCCDLMGFKESSGLGTRDREGLGVL